MRKTTNNKVKFIICLILFIYLFIMQIIIYIKQFIILMLYVYFHNKTFLLFKSLFNKNTYFKTYKLVINSFLFLSLVIDSS